MTSVPHSAPHMLRSPPMMTPVIRMMEKVMVYALGADVVDIVRVEAPCDAGEHRGQHEDLNLAVGSVDPQGLRRRLGLVQGPKRAAHP